MTVDTNDSLENNQKNKGLKTIPNHIEKQKGKLTGQGSGAWVDTLIERFSETEVGKYGTKHRQQRPAWNKPCRIIRHIRFVGKFGGDFLCFWEGGGGVENFDTRPAQQLYSFFFYVSGGIFGFHSFR